MSKKDLPDICYGYMPAEPDVVTAIKRDERGYFPTEFKGGKAKAIALNADLGISVAQMEAMMAGSMFGWHTKAADPAVYDEAGNVDPRKVKVS
jgi:hypothetical protein